MSLPWTITRAIMENHGLGGKYSNFAKFTLKEILKHTDFYLYQFLPPSPQVEMNIYYSKDNPVNGRDIIHHAFGYVTWISISRHKHFKILFYSVDTTADTTSQEYHTNCKLNPLLKNMIHVSKEAIFLGIKYFAMIKKLDFRGMIKTYK